MKFLLYILLAIASTVYAKGPEPSVLLYNITDGKSTVSENTDVQRPLASLTKIMTAMVVLDQNPNLDETIAKKINGPLPKGTWSRKDLLAALLIRSDNTAAETLAETYPGGRSSFMIAMNARAQSLGMTQTFFEDPSGLSRNNVSSASDVHKMLVASMNYSAIKDLSVQKQVMFDTYYKKKIRKVVLHNTNSKLLFEFDNIVITKTGYTNPAGFCLGLIVEQKGKYYAVVIMGTPTPLFRFNLARKILRQEIPYNNLFDSDLR